MHYLTQDTTYKTQYIGRHLGGDFGAEVDYISWILCRRETIRGSHLVSFGANRSLLSWVTLWGEESIRGQERHYQGQLQFKMCWLLVLTTLFHENAIKYLTFLTSGILRNALFIWPLFNSASQLRTNSYFQWRPRNRTTDLYLVSSGIWTCNRTTRLPCRHLVLKNLCRLPIMFPLLYYNIQ
jgi:hypothetical protein